MLKGKRLLRRQKRMLRDAKEKADYLHSLNGKTYYVIWTGKKYLVATSKNIEEAIKETKKGVDVQTVKTRLINTAVYRAC